MSLITDYLISIHNVCMTISVAELKIYQNTVFTKKYFIN